MRRSRLPTGHDIMRGAETCLRSLATGHASASFGPADGSWVVIVSIEPTRSRQLIDVLQTLPGKGGRDPILLAAEKRIEKLETALRTYLEAVAEFQGTKDGSAEEAVAEEAMEDALDGLCELFPEPPPPTGVIVGEA